MIAKPPYKYGTRFTQEVYIKGRIVLHDVYFHNGKNRNELTLAEDIDGNIIIYNNDNEVITTVKTIHGLQTALQCLYAGLKI